jgi:hypothetical protein
MTAYSTAPVDDVLHTRQPPARITLAAVIEENDGMWWSDLLYGIWNGLTAWFVLVVHVFGGWAGFPVYDVTRGGNWYDFGFLLGAGSPFLGAVRGWR